MTDRIQRVLDGELDRSALDPRELVGLQVAESILSGVIRAVPVHPLADLSAAVLKRIDCEQRVRASHAVSPLAALHALWSWLWQPHSIALRPAYGVAVIALFALSPALPFAVSDQPVMPAVQPVLVQFRLDAPAAQQVALVGAFSDWRPTHSMTRSGPGVWTVVVALEPGIHDYSFVVDGERWTADPAAAAVADGFGGVNSRIAVLPADPRKS